MSFKFNLSTRFAALALCLMLLSSSIAAPKISSKQEAFFEAKIRPVLVQECYKCHSAGSKKIGGELLLDTRAGLLAGGESGPAIVPKDIKSSMLIEALKHEGLEMPPKKKLSDRVIADFEKWIRMGAPDPRSGKTIKIQKKIDFKEARKHWSFRPRKVSTAPQVKQKDWPRSDLDKFVLAKLESKNLKPVADAEKQKLVRRIYFDLIGLPPTPEQLNFVMRDKSSDAIEKLVDKLLASKHFGERWGRHWLDVVRYGESTGMERNYTFPHAWRYRDYVIDSFNNDKPYTQFIREQLAGDLLPARTGKQKNELIIATGMLAIGPKSLNNRDPVKFQLDVIDDQIDVTTRAFLGLTASCARCHDHKFDPIPMTEYYALAGIFQSTNTYFSNTRMRKNNKKNNGPKVGLLPLTGGDKNAASVSQAKQQRLASLNFDLQNAQRDLRRAINSAIANQPKKGKNKKDKKDKKKKKNKNVNNAQIKQIRKKISGIQKQIAAASKGGGKNTGPLAMAVGEKPNCSNCRLRIRGDSKQVGDEVPRGVLTIATVAQSTKISSRGSGRLELANWIINKRNPLTARVMVNRIWHHLFGQGIVRSMNNFGLMGEEPSDVELLDHLAARFEKNNWSMKQLIREIMLSRTYQLSTQFDAKNFKIDPENRLVWRMNHRRLDAESLRDSILAASGNLNRKAYVGSLVQKYGEAQVRNASGQGDFSHRSVYLPIIRGHVPEILTIFDFPEASIMGGRRDVSTVPTQALYFLNSSFVNQQSKQMAKRVMESGTDPTDRVELAYKLALSREPSSKEKINAQKFFALLQQSDNSDSGKKQSESDIWTYFCQSLLCTAEFRYLD